jgi:hypothetical protein
MARLRGKRPVAIRQSRRELDIAPMRSQQRPASIAGASGVRASSASISAIASGGELAQDKPAIAGMLVHRGVVRPEALGPRHSGSGLFVAAQLGERKRAEGMAETPARRQRDRPVEIRQRLGRALAQLAFAVLHRLVHGVDERLPLRRRLRRGLGDRGRGDGREGEDRKSKGLQSATPVRRARHISAA